MTDVLLLALFAGAVLHLVHFLRVKQGGERTRLVKVGDALYLPLLGALVIGNLSHRIATEATLRALTFLSGHTLGLVLVLYILFASLGAVVLYTLALPTPRSAA